MKKTAIIYMAHDGFTSLYTGVGTIARDFLLSFPQVRTNLLGQFPNISLDLFVATIKYDYPCLGYSDTYKQSILEFISQNDSIHLVEVLNDSSGELSWGSVGNWQAASISGATLIATLSEYYDRIIVIAVDTPFAQVGNYYFKQFHPTNVDVIWLPQSTSKIHDLGDTLETLHQGQSDTNARYEWEKQAVTFANSHPNMRVGYVGEFMKKHLVDDYCAEISNLISVTNGLYFDRLKENILTQLQIGQLLQKMNIPLDRPILFSFGRAEPYKGLDLVIKNSYNLVKHHNYFVLILCSPYTSHDIYVDEIQLIAREFGDNIKIIAELDFITPHYIMQWHNTKILAVLSRAEPFGLIPIESRFYRNEHMMLLVSNVGGLPDQVDHELDGFITDLDDNAIRDQLNIISSMTLEERKVVSERGYKRVLGDYDQIKINTKLLALFLS